MEKKELQLFNEYQTRDQIALKPHKKAKDKGDEPFSLPQMQGQAHNAAASSEVTIENALQYIRKRLGFVNHKMKLQQEINFIINDLLEKKAMEEEQSRLQTEMDRSEEEDDTQSKTTNSVVHEHTKQRVNRMRQSQLQVISEMDQTIINQTFDTSSQGSIKRVGVEKRNSQQNLEKQPSESRNLSDEKKPQTVNRQSLRQKFNRLRQKSEKSRKVQVDDSTKTETAAPPVRILKNANRKVSESVHLKKDDSLDSFQVEKLPKVSMADDYKAMIAQKKEALRDRHQMANLMRSPIQKQHRHMLSQLNGVIDKVDLSDHYKMHLERANKSKSVAYKLEKPRASQAKKKTIVDSSVFLKIDEGQSSEEDSESLISQTSSRRVSSIAGKSSRKLLGASDSRVSFGSQVLEANRKRRGTIYNRPDTTWTHLDFMKGSDPKAMKEGQGIKDQIKQIRQMINERYDLYAHLNKKKEEKEQVDKEKTEYLELLNFLDDASKELLEQEDLDNEIREMIMAQAQEAREEEAERKRQDEIEKKLAKMERSGGMSANDIINLMNDDMLVDRYTKHLNDIMFKYQDRFIKGKYDAWIELTEPKKQLDFFQRMKLDKQQRE